jgi:hypothetical protein
MAMSVPQTPSQDGVTPLKTKGEIDEVRLEAALGHKQELKRNFGLWSLTSLGIVIAKYVLDWHLRSSIYKTNPDLALGLPRAEQSLQHFKMVVQWLSYTA